MATVRAVAVRWVDDAQPGFVEVVLTDAARREWQLVDKVPVFGDDRMTADAAYPFEVDLECDVVLAGSAETVLVALRHGSRHLTEPPSS